MADLTTTLRLELEKTSQHFVRWSSSQRQWLSAQQQNYESALEQLEAAAAALQRSGAQLEAAQQQQQTLKQQQRRDEQSVWQRQGELKDALQDAEALLRDARRDELDVSSRLDSLKAENERLKKAMEQKLHDLTFGVQHFNHLGLEFQKAANDCMKFNFVHIDPNLPSRVFSFVIFVDETNTYQLVETSPFLGKDETSKVLNELNVTNNISHFVVGIRKLFVKYIKQQGVV